MVTYVKISELPPATEATGDSELEVNQAGVTRRITVDQIADAIAEILPPPDMSDYATDEELADAIAAIPPADWASISGKPSTFPPTTPIPYTSISDTPTSLPPSGTAGGDLSATYPNPTVFKASGAFAVTGALTGTTATFSGAVTVSAGTVATPAIRHPTVTNTGIYWRNAAAFNLAFSGTMRYELGSGGDINVGGPGAVGLFMNAVNAATANDTSVTRLGAGIVGIGNGTAGNSSGTIQFATQTPGTNNTTGATTAFVTAAVAAAPAAVLQTVSFQTGAVATGTTVTPGDDTIPQITEGTEFMTLSITPRSATSKLVIEVTACLSCSAVAGVIAALHQDSTANAIATGYWVCPVAAHYNVISFRHAMVSGTTSATTFRVRAGPTAAGTITFNGQAGARVLGGVLASSIVIQEVAP